VKKRKKRIRATIDDCLDFSFEAEFDSIKKDDYFFTERDRVTVIFGIKEDTIKGVINVSYEVFINNKWITILRFDSVHGYLHRHTRISLDNPDTTVENFSVIQKGGPKEWLTWARKYMNKYFYKCKVGFCRRSKINIIDLS
jgi:hypothetical protein